MSRICETDYVSIRDLRKFNVLKVLYKFLKMKSKIYANSKSAKVKSFFWKIEYA